MNKTLKELDLTLVNENETLDDLQLDGLHLIQKKEGFRFGVDAVLLANFANVNRKHSVLDLCTGTGIIPFIIYGKKNPKEVVGIEIQELAIARHEIMCNLEDVIAASRRFLKDNGRLYMVHRPERLADIFCLMRKYKIEPKRVRMVHPNTKKAANIVLVEGQRDGGAFLKWEAPLYVYKDEGGYSEEIDKIYGRESK